MSDMTARLALPMIVPGQAQKEMSHNEALALIDAALHPSVVGFNVDAPPPDPASGQCWIVGAAPTGDWRGHARHVAIATTSGWRFVMPTEGFSAWVVDPGFDARFVEGAWVLGSVVGERLILDGAELLSTPVAAISAPAGGATVDSQARAAIAAILAALRHHKLIQTA